MAKPNAALEKYKSDDGGLGPATDDNCLVKLRTLKKFGAWILSQIPVPGNGLSLRRSPDGDIWGLGDGESAQAFGIAPDGKVTPAMVGTEMPTINGYPLDDTTEVLDMSIDGPVYFRLDFTVNYVEGYLSSWTLDSVSVEQDASLPSDSDDTKYLQFNSIVGGVTAGPSYFNQSVNVRLLDNGATHTRLEYNP